VEDLASIATGRALRLSAQAYNTPEQYQRLATALMKKLR
jgi:hypothetical protein